MVLLNKHNSLMDVKREAHMKSWDIDAARNGVKIIDYDIYFKWLKEYYVMNALLFLVGVLFGMLLLIFGGL